MGVPIQEGGREMEGEGENVRGTEEEGSGHVTTQRVSEVLFACAARVLLQSWMLRMQTSAEGMKAFAHAQRRDGNLCAGVEADSNYFNEALHGWRCQRTAGAWMDILAQRW